MSDQYLIRFNGAYYRQDANGYTDSVFVAGRFSMSDALKHGEREGTQIVLDDPKNLRGYMDEGERVAQDRIAALEARCAGLERELARSDDEAVFGDHNLIPHYKAKLAAAEEALRHTCKHLCQWKDACEVGCPVSAALADTTTDEV